jgi:hypothetical protein
MSALDSHPQVNGILMEPFNTGDQDLAQDLIPIMREVYGKDYLTKTTDDLKPLVDYILEKYDGFKILYYQIGFGDAAWEYLRAKHLKVIHLTRRNTLEREISQQIAENTQVWHRSHASESPPEPQITMDAARLKNIFALEQREFERAETFFELSDKLTLGYEDLRDDYSGAMQQVQEFLGLPIVDLAPAYLKRTRGSKAELVTNYRKLKTHFRRSKWARFFDE